MSSSLDRVNGESKTVNASLLKKAVGELKPSPELFVAVGFCCALLLALRLAGIPWQFSTANFVERYIAVALQSVAYALILAATQTPQSMLGPLWERYRKSPIRILIVMMLGTLFFSLYPALVACIFLVIGIAILEAYERQVYPAQLGNALLPGCYLFVGLVSVFGFNALIVSTRTPNYSGVLDKIDSFLLLGHSVSELSHRFCAATPHFITNLLMVSYFALFAQIGACLLLATFLAGRTEAMKFVSTILVAYLLTMATFALFPSYSPYFSCGDHQHSALPSMVLDTQQKLMNQAALRHHHDPVPIDTEYYVAFPCMHITQPLIVLWFVRRWRRIFAALVVIDLVLVFAIVLLEWHYVTDLLGGIAVAAIAIAVTSHAYGGRSKSELKLNMSA